MFLDKCCDDMQWLAAVFGPGMMTVLLDNHHLIARYRDNSNGVDRARH